MTNAFALPNTGAPIEGNVLPLPVVCGNPKEIIDGVDLLMSAGFCKIDEFSGVVGVVVVMTVGLATVGNVNDGDVAEKQNPPSRGTESVDVLVV